MSEDFRRYVRDIDMEIANGLHSAPWQREQVEAFWGASAKRKAPPRVIWIGNPRDSRSFCGAWLRQQREVAVFDAEAAKWQ